MQRTNNEKFSHSPTTSLIVERDNVTAENTSSGKNFNVRWLSLSRSRQGEPFGYYSLSNLSHTKKLDIMMRNGTDLETINLPEHMLSNMADYLSVEHEPREDRFDCADFVHFVNDIPYESTHFRPEAWNISKLQSEDQLVSGDSIFIACANNPKDYGITHMAIYIGNQLYLSKFGNAGRLIVTDLDEMKKGFEGDFTYKVTPAQI